MASICKNEWVDIIVGIDVEIDDAAVIVKMLRMVYSKMDIEEWLRKSQGEEAANAKKPQSKEAGRSGTKSSSSQ